MTITFNIDRLKSGSGAPLHEKVPHRLEAQPAFVTLDAGGQVNVRVESFYVSATKSMVAEFPVPASVNGASLISYLQGRGYALLEKIHVGQDVQASRAALEHDLQNLPCVHASTAWDYLFADQGISVCNPADPVFGCWTTQLLAEVVAKLEREAANQGITIADSFGETLLLAAGHDLSHGNAVWLRGYQSDGRSLRCTGKRWTYHAGADGHTRESRGPRLGRRQMSIVASQFKTRHLRGDQPIVKSRLYATTDSYIFSVTI